MNITFDPDEFDLWLEAVAALVGHDITTSDELLTTLHQWFRTRITPAEAANWLKEGK